PTLLCNEVHEVTAEMAANLVHAALKGEGAGATELPGFRLELMNKPVDARFYYFEASWSNPQPAGVVIGHYAVDPFTGDVWNGIVCSEITSRSLRKVQRKVRHSLGITEERYRKLRRQGPMC